MHNLWMQALEILSGKKKNNNNNKIKFLLQATDEGTIYNTGTIANVFLKAFCRHLMIIQFQTMYYKLNCK